MMYAVLTNANRYTFVWRGSINYHLTGLLDTIDAFYTRYNTLFSGSGYDKKYSLGEVQMFVIEGMDRVREVTPSFVPLTPFISVVGNQLSPIKNSIA